VNQAREKDNEEKWAEAANLYMTGIEYLLLARKCK